MAVARPRKIFVNLPVKSLDKSVEFFTRLGFEFDPRFTDDKGTCMVLSDEAYVMLLVEDFFKTFVKKDLCDTATHIEGIFAITAENREAVDELVASALAAGGSPAGDPQDHSIMYTSSFHDLDGHMWEVFSMDPAQAPA